MQLSYVENNTYFLSMDSSIDGNLYMSLHKKIDENTGERLLRVKITERSYKKGAKLYHDFEDQINKNTLSEEYINNVRSEIAGLNI